MPDVKDHLKIGDFITLKNMKHDGFLSAEGILLEDVVVNGSLATISDSTFCVHLQRQYSALTELNEFMNLYHFGDQGPPQENSSTAKYLHALKRGLQNENILNESYMQQKMGQPVLFGDVIQLVHVKSGKFLTIKKDMLAHDERENLKVLLTSDGSPFSWLTVSPRYKIDRVGDRIFHNTEMYLKVAERSSEYVHCSEFDPLFGQFREVNCSLESSSWRVGIFQNSTDSMDKSLLLASQLVSITDPETKSALMIVKREVKSLDEKNSSDTTVDIVNESDISLEDSMSIGSSVSSDCFYHEFGDVVIRPMPLTQLDSNALWIIEAKNVTQGGAIYWKTDMVRFKNLNSGEYLLMYEEEEMDENGCLTERHILTVTSNPAEIGTLFNVRELQSPRLQLGNQKALQIAFNGIWIERGSVLDDLSYMALGCKNKSFAASLIVSRFSNEKTEEEEEDFADGSGALEELATKGSNAGPLDVYVGVAARSYIQYFFDLTVIPDPDSICSTIWPGTERTKIDFFKFIMEKTNWFCQGFPISVTHVVDGVDKADPNLRTRRQDQLREQGILEITLRIINKLVDISTQSLIIAQMIKFNTHVSDERMCVNRMGQIVLKLCFNLIFSAIRDHPQNQMYVADFMPVLLVHLSAQALAGKCVTEMLSNNMELQETKIGTREIAIFVEQLRESRMNAMFLRLLQSCCSCQGKGVDGNQCKVAEMLFANTNDIIIQLHADNSKLQSVSWASSGLYISAVPVPGSPILGDSLLHRGLPMLSLSWTTNSIDYSPLGLFGKLSVSIEDLYHASGIVSTTATGEKAVVGRKSKTYEQKMQVADYFIAEMYLGAEMCMDRNYVAMGKLDEMFPYEVLVTILKLGVNDTLKAAAARLLLCLHVDRDPQAETKIPCLTRTWTDIVKHKTPQLPYVDVSRRNVYALLQQLLAEHIVGMQGNRWDPVSLQMLRMLKSLVAFNFYGTNDRLADVIIPLIRAVDRRTVDFSDVAAATPVKKKKEKKEEVDDIEKDMKTLLDDGEDKEEGKEEDDMMDASGSVVEEEKEWEIDESTWQFRMLSFLLSLKVLVFILALVAVAVGMTISQFIENKEPLWQVILGYIILVIFVVEFSARFGCYYYVYREYREFSASFFNQVDMAVILIDIAFLLIPSGGSAGNFAKVLRLVRLTRLVRLLRAAKVVAVLTAVEVKSLANWKAPVRYAKAPIFELETMEEALRILALAQNVIDDRNVSLLMRHFYAWENGSDARTPSEIFENVILESEELSLHTEDSDAILVDVVMFQHAPLVQCTLEVLMNHHSSRSMLLTNAKNVQLLVSPRRERQYKLIDQMLLQLERNAETHELWGELQNEADYESSKQTFEILTELIEVCRIRSKVINFENIHDADHEIQDLLRNVGCFGICMKVVGLLESVQEDEAGELDEVGQNTKELVMQANTLLHWFLMGNSQNQELAFTSLQLFIDTLDEGINSHLVIQSLFKNNEKLMKLVPHAMVDDMAEKICKDGKSHHYLMLLDTITNVGEKNITENQYEIIRALTSPGRFQKVSCFLVPPDHPDYEEKRAMMAPLLGEKNLTFEDLPPLLAYHLLFFNVLSSCTVGRLNVTSVEAKVQAIVRYEDIVRSMLDPGTILLAKVHMGWFYFDAIVDVEMVIPGFETSICLWDHLFTCPGVFDELFAELELAVEHGWESNAVDRVCIEYGIVCVFIVASFFSRYFDRNTFKTYEKGTTVVSNSTSVVLSSEILDDLICKMFDRLIVIHRKNYSILADHHKEMIVEALEAFIKSSRAVDSSALAAIVPTAVEVEEPLGELSNEQRVVNRYHDFISQLESDEELQVKQAKESMAFITEIESIPFLISNADTDVRYEPFIRKLTSHARSMLKTVNNEKVLDTNCTQTSKWIVKAFRTLIENKWGMTILERDDEGGEDEDIACKEVVEALNACGVMTLCIDLIAVGIDADLQAEALKLCVAMLFKEGGALLIQQSIFNYLNKINSEMFFKQIRLSFQKLIAWHNWKGVVELDDDEEVSLPEDIIMIRFLQLTCEGHYLPNQDLLREQPSNHISINLLDDMVAYLNCLSRIPCRTSTDAAIRIASTILEVLQGPCEKNQSYFALSTELIETLNRIMRSKAVLDCVEEEEMQLKMIVVDVFQGLLEGQPSESVVYERVLSVIHLDVIQLFGNVEDVDNAGEDAFLLQTECVVLLQMLCNYKPSLRKELGMSDDIDSVVGDGTACVEVVWRGEIQRRFFHVPDICANLSKTSKDILVENVDRSNMEVKLLEFLERANEMYREVNHQQYLIDRGISTIFSPKNQNRATWFAFVLVCLINLLYMVFYTVRDGDPQYPNEVGSAINALNILQFVVSIFTFTLNVVVKSPVLYNSAIANGATHTGAIISAGTDTMTVYYFGYMVFALLGLVHSDIWVAFLLFDIIVKDSTTRAVLMAIYYPRKQIGMACLLGVFVAYIHAFFYFFFFRNDITLDVASPGFCHTLWACFKTMLDYGLRQPGGVGDIMQHDLGPRFALDMTFFIVVLVILLNVIFGIIIDTFAGLRSQKAERLLDTTETCFICGINKQVFDRASDGTDGFKTHIKFDHNMWNYMYFIMFLWQQDKDDDDGLELYIRQCIAKKDISWFPIGKAIRLNQTTSKDDDICNEMKGDIVETTEKMGEHCVALTPLMSKLMGQLHDALKNETLIAATAAAAGK